MKRRISVGNFHLGDDERKAIIEVLDTGRISEGVKVREFERLWANYIGTRYAVAVSSGTAALMVGLSSLRYVRNRSHAERKKVITTPITYIATSNALVVTGYEPVYVDVDLETFIITADAIRTYLKEIKDVESYALILPVHLMGYPCDMDEINKIANDYDLDVIEDSAQAHGTLYRNKKVGSISLFSIFSFYVAHNIQAGEMGALNSNDQEINRLVRKLKANGRLCDCLVCRRPQGKCPRISLNEEDHDPRFTHDLVGYNFKIMEFQAALGISQLKKANWIFNKRQENVKYLNEKLKKFTSVLKLPIYSTEVSYLAYPIVIKDPRVITRKEMRSRLEKEGVETRPIFGCIPTQQPAYAHLEELYKGRLPNAEYIGRNGFYIGCHQYLTKDDLDYTVEVFEKVLK